MNRTDTGRMGPRRLCVATACLIIGATAVAATIDQSDLPAPAEQPPAAVPAFRAEGPDTLRTNLWVAEALLGSVVSDLLLDLPPPPARILLVPASTEPAANLLTSVATNMLQRAGHKVHLDKVPPGTEEPVIELRYRVEGLQLDYPATGRRLGLWKSWFSRRMAFTAQVTVVNRFDGQVLSSRRISRTFMDRVPYDHRAVIESSSYSFTQAQPQASGWTRRLEEIVVLGALAGLVAIYFANIE